MESFCVAFNSYWFNYGRRACSHESSRAVTSVTSSSIIPVPQLSLLLDESWTRRSVSTWRWRFKQLHPFRGQSLQMSCWEDGEFAKGIRHSLYQHQSSNPFGMQDRAVKLFSKEAPELEAIFEGNRSLWTQYLNFNLQLCRSCGRGIKPE